MQNILNVFIFCKSEVSWKLKVPLQKKSSLQKPLLEQQMTAWTLCLTTSPKLIKELDTSANTQFKLIAIGRAQLSGLCGIVAELRKVLKQFYRDLYF